MVILAIPKIKSMKALRCISILCMLLVVASFNSCKDDDDKSVSGITDQSWQKGRALEITLGKELSVSFNANSDWEAASGSEWCKLLDTEGKSGKSTLRIMAATTTNASRTATITVKVKGYDSESFLVIQNETGDAVSEDMEINVQVDQYLREMYLWNDEYKTLQLDFTKDYMSFFYDALGSMKTNTLDKKFTSPGEYRIFSFIEKKNSIASSRSTKIVEKELEYSFGITGVTPLYVEDNVYNFCIQGVYANSPAKAAGLKRGSIITQINGGNLTSGNVNDYYMKLLYPSSVATLQITDYDHKQTSITSTPMYVDPVILKQVKELNGHRIGYLVYSSFDAAFDEELFEAFKYFKSQNITDLILDLRYNGGGHTMSANLIASCIVGASATNKVFSSLRYNATRMKAMNDKRDDQYFMYDNYPNLGISLAAGDLGLTHVYCLVGSGTASSSELVINSLRGINVEVTLIGEKTTGKNVGMEPEMITAKGNTYILYPITFQSYNAKGFGDYEAGFIPDKGMDESDPFGEEEVFYIYREYGSDREFLYAEAVKMITGIDILPQSRSIAAYSIKGKKQKMRIPVKHGFDGMIKIPLEQY